ncbi:MAG: hypothetical protein WC178_05005 [Candidatus Paceibacterota bacterium]
MKKLLLLLAMFFTCAFNASASTIPEGAIIKTVNNPDVYIVKYLNGKQYKRLVLNPLVFKSYGHLKWENLLTVTQMQMDGFVNSDLVRVDGSADVYQLIPNGDTGKKLYLGAGANYDLSSIYTINSVDFNNYILDQVASLIKAQEGLNKTNDELIALQAKKLAEQEAALKAQQEENQRIADLAEQIIIEQQKKELVEKQAKLDRMIAGNKIFAQMVTEVDSIDAEMSSLKAKIDEIDARIDHIEEQAIAQSFINGQAAPLYAERNSYADTYNSLLANRNYFSEISDAIVSYQDYGIAIPSKYKSFLNSYGIYY